MPERLRIEPKESIHRLNLYDPGLDGVVVVARERLAYRYWM